jgi:hypothetical protein
MLGNVRSGRRTISMPVLHAHEPKNPKGQARAGGGGGLLPVQEGVNATIFTTIRGVPAYFLGFRCAGI